MRNPGVEPVVQTDVSVVKTAVIFQTGVFWWLSRTQDDALIAMQMQREELIRKHAEAKQRELEDRVIISNIFS